MFKITPFMRWLAAQVEKVGWSETLRRGKGAFTAGALQGWLRGSLPGPGNQATIAKVFGVTPETVKELVWQSWQIKDGVSARPPMGERPPGSLSPVQRARRRRQRLVAYLLWLVSGGWSVVPPPVVASSLITDHAQPRVRIEGFCRLRRWALA